MIPWMMVLWVFVSLFLSVYACTCCCCWFVFVSTEVEAEVDPMEEVVDAQEEVVEEAADEEDAEATVTIHRARVVDAIANPSWFAFRYQGENLFVG